MILPVSWLLPLFVFLGVFPWITAWLAVRKMSLSHAMAWTVAAWIAWLIVAAAPSGPHGDNQDAAAEPMRYLALCLTACAGVAVLGARRPHVAAWNFVVAGLLAVMALPLLENLILGNRPIGAVRIGFLAVTLTVVLGNFVPTGLGPAALLAGAGCAGQMWVMLAPANAVEFVPIVANLAVGLVPWAGWLCWVVWRRPSTELERRWLNFRDRFGTLWSLRVREQFNHAAEHAGWPVLLSWTGTAVRGTASQSGDDEADMLAAFESLIRRFAAVEPGKS